MAEARLHTDSLLPRPLLIYFPGMEIEDCGAPLQSVQPFQKPSRNRIGPKPEIAAAPSRNVLAEQTQRGDRQFQHSVAAARIIRKSRSVRHPIMVMPDRVNA